ncbi:MAG: hypothetical protein NTY23_11580 [Chloroflexi bacterium]|nr:hypothetical protein [Chloroflexota bacterium]
MRHFPQHRITSGFTFEEKVGPPDVLTSAIGHLICEFSRLERWLDIHIANLSGTEDRAALDQLRELTFPSKLSVLLDLAPRRIDKADAESIEMLRELVGLCQEAQQHLDHVMDSAWSWDFASVALQSNDGQIITADHIMDLADFVSNVASDLEEWPAASGEAT